MPTPDYKPPTSARELLDRRSLGDRDFRFAHLRRAVLSGVDLRGVDLRGADLDEADMRGADLRDVRLEGASVKQANLVGARLNRARLGRLRVDPSGFVLPSASPSAMGDERVGPANLTGSNLEGVELVDASLLETVLAGANLCEADLTNACLWRADLTGSNLYRSKLQGADLTEARLISARLTSSLLSFADFTAADLSKADVSGSFVSDALFIDVDLSRVGGLISLSHFAPSTIDHRSIVKSGRLPATFLKGVGLADWQIEEAKLLQPDLTPTEITDILYRVAELRSAHPLQVRPVFISYSHADTSFVDVLEAELNGVGIRFWRDIHDMEAGPLEPQVHRAMEDRVAVIVLSNASTQSDWVEHEVRHARELAKKQHRHTLCPIALDDSWKTWAWPARLREQVEEFAILDFSAWQDRMRMSEMFVKLERGLRKWYR